jgi:hypothetical protein
VKPRNRGSKSALVRATSLAGALVSASLGLAPEAASADLLRNNGFESHTAGWSSNRSTVVHAMRGFKSPGAARVRPNGGGGFSSIYQHSGRPTVAGAAYVATAWARARSGRSICLQIRELRIRSRSRECVRATGDWQKLTVIHDARADDHRLVVSIGEIRVGPSSPFRVDQIYLKPARLSASWPGVAWRMFSEASPWNAALDTSNVDPNSQTMIDKMVADGPPSAVTQNVLLNWGYPIYFGRSNDPLYTLSLTDNSEVSKATTGSKIHLPLGAQPNKGSDGQMRIIDEAANYAYHIERCSLNNTAHTLSCWRGTKYVADGNGFRYDIAADQAPGTAGPIRPEELAAGYVNHTMLAMMRCLSGHNIAPMNGFVTVGKTCSGDTNPDATRLSIGNVIFLDLTHAQIDALGLPLWEQAILKGLHDHGMVVVGNTGGPSWALKFESYADRTLFGEPNPYSAYGVPMNMDFSHALDTVGGWDVHLKVIAPFVRPCLDICL